MYDKYFGSYLLNKNILTSSQLVKALEHMKKVKVKFGTLAIEQGWLTGEEVEEILRIQRSSDMFFGEIAIGKGFISLEKVGILLNMQSSASKLQLGQAAVDLGFLSYEELDRELSNFEAESGLDSAQLDILEEGETEKIIVEFVDFGRSDYAPVLYDYLSLLMRNITRFLDQQPWIDLEKPSLEGDLVTSYQYLEHEKGKIYSGISMNKETFLETARLFAGMSVEGEPELAEASVTEFLNLHNGILSVNMSEQGEVLKLTPPEITRSHLPGSMPQSHLIGINLGYGKLFLELAGIG